MRRIAGLWVVCVLWATLTWAASARPKGPKPKAERLEVWAERIEYHSDTGKFTFVGNVTVIKGTLRVDCKDMEGFVDPKTRRIHKVRALGNVRMMTVAEAKAGAGGRRPKAVPAGPDAWRAASGKADYDLRVGRLVLSGKHGDARPRLWRADGYGEADKIVFVPGKGEYELIGDPVIRGEIPVGPATPGPAPTPKKPQE